MIEKSENHVETTYISTACNRTPSCADWNSGNIMCFGAANSIALFDTNYNGSAKITNTFAGHKGKVNSVRWVRSDASTISNDFVSGSVDGTAIVWTKSGDSYTFSAHLTDHKQGVTVADARYITVQDVKTLYVATASVDSTVKIWKRIESEDVKCIQTIELGNGLCLTLQLFILPTANIPILACGLDDNKIHLFAEKINNQYELIFSKVQVLSGHEDWVRGLDFIQIGKKVMLASCSQDTHIRLWSIEPHIEVEVTENDGLKIEKKLFSCGDIDWAVSLDAILSGHEGWVYGVHWNYDPSAANKLKLLSSSIDKTLIIWEPDISDGTEGIWMESIRVGEVGGNGLGFYGGRFSQDGNTIMGHGYAGSFHIWKRKEGTTSWEPAVVCGGHYDEVVDLGWEPEGNFLISISTDQTTRVHAPWVRDASPITTWHELARPQIHGFDMSCLAIVSKFCFASGAEEKVIRTFQAPKNFVSNYHLICKNNDTDSASLEGVCQGASVPSLGLSNKAVFTNEQPNVNTEEKHVKDLYPDYYFVPIDMEEPPTEETLMQNTLWPEMHKLYGHGYEVFSLAASSDGKFLASACKATTPQHATILIWDTKTWIQVQSLASHHLTITQLSFSPDSQSLVSVSRDRRWSVFHRSADDSFTLAGTTDKSNGIHTRIIWCCAWTYDSNFFFTGSRDGKIVMWGKSNNPSNESSTGPYCNVTLPLELKSQSVTAISTTSSSSTEQYILAAGFESGLISLYITNHRLSGKEWNLIITLDNNIAHHLTVKRLSFRPKKSSPDPDSNSLQLASCSCDHSVKIYDFNNSIFNI